MLRPYGTRSPGLRVSGSPGLLLIGYGNELRGDDGAGPRLARAVARRGLAGVRARAVHQLTPELAAEIAAAPQVIFVDAGAGPDRVAVETRALAPGGVPSALGHAGDPAALLALAAALYGRCPPAWLITIPARDFTLGARLSPTAARGVRAALRAARRLIAARAQTADRDGS